MEGQHMGDTITGLYVGAWVTLMVISAIWRYRHADSVGMWVSLVMAGSGLLLLFPHEAAFAQ
ncbi:hypothetical protein C7I87_00745 [Mesorhizobium sp. SARCC-RB16n]|nr:hypothetical protein C7I87_00745 [Mesorhizobium sp. SARCC-RB16n]